MLGGSTVYGWDVVAFDKEERWYNVHEAMSFVVFFFFSFFFFPSFPCHCPSSFFFPEWLVNHVVLVYLLSNVRGV